MPFVLPLTDQEAENARLLDRLTKQQEENQSLRVENAQLKDWATTAQAKADKLESELADYKRIAEQREKTMRELRAEINLYTNGMSLEEWHDDMEQQKAEITDDAERDIAQLSADLAMKDGIIDRLREAKYQLGIRKDEEHKAEVEKLKRQQCDTEYELTYYKDYVMGAPNGWGEFAEECSRGIKGKDININWSWLEDDFNLFSVVYYYADPITGEPIETKTTMIRDKNEIEDIDNPAPEELEEHKEFFSDCVLGATIKSMELIKVYDFTEDTCDFCDKERKVLTKRDAGYDEWTCSDCHKEQYPEQYEENQ